MTSMERWDICSTEGHQEEGWLVRLYTELLQVASASRKKRKKFKRSKRERQRKDKGGKRERDRDRERERERERDSRVESLLGLVSAAPHFPASPHYLLGA